MKTLFGGLCSQRQTPKRHGLKHKLPNKSCAAGWGESHDQRLQGARSQLFVLGSKLGQFGASLRISGSRGRRDWPNWHAGLVASFLLRGRLHGALAAQVVLPARRGKSHCSQFLGQSDLGQNLWSSKILAKFLEQ